MLPTKSAAQMTPNTRRVVIGTGDVARGRSDVWSGYAQNMRAVTLGRQLRPGWLRSAVSSAHNHEARPVEWHILDVPGND